MCNSPDILAEGLNLDIPDMNEKSQPRPGKLRLTESAIDSRLRRVFQPNVHGQYKVSAEILQQWNDKKGKKNLQHLFQSCGFSPDWVWEKLFYMSFQFNVYRLIILVEN